jgi:hypothetical protein
MHLCTDLHTISISKHAGLGVYSKINTIVETSGTRISSSAAAASRKYILRCYNHTTYTTQLF